MKRILIVENNQDFAYAIQWHFQQKGFQVESISSGEKAIELYQNCLFDVILLDINLDGEIDGKEVARFIRNIDKQIPIIFMSGESKSPKDVVEGFEIGCNFFLKKPVSIEEIEVHINALQKTKSKSVYEFKQCIFNADEQILIANGNNENLSEKETQVLRYLAENFFKIVPLADISEEVWDDAFMEESLRNIISSLRKKINDKGLKITTIKSKGYRLEYL
ncbi:response regulator transcription factor [Weeksellaceae bacterium TAE3-ERU29]|nr:response regulator transcription factor [Weeksellaceae bacterium TAE3-ERU29]